MRLSKSRSDGSKAGQKRMQAGPQDIVRLQTSDPLQQIAALHIKVATHLEGFMKDSRNPDPAP